MTNVKIMLAQAIEKLDAMSPEEFTTMLLECGYPAEELLHASIEKNVELKNDLAVANDYREGAKKYIAELKASSCPQMSDIECTCGAEMDGYLGKKTQQQMYRCPRCPGIEITEAALFASARNKIAKLEDKLAHAEFLRSYYVTILDGSWPSSAEVMALQGWFRKEHLGSNG